MPLLFLISVIKRKEKNPLNDNSVVAEGQLQKGKRAELYMTMEKSSAESFAKLLTPPQDPELALCDDNWIK